MSLQKLKNIFKKYDGGTLKFKDSHQQRTYYFEMNYNQFLPIYKSLKSKTNLFYVLSSDGNHNVLNYNELKRLFPSNNYMNTIIRQNQKSFGVCDEDYMLQLLINMSCPELDNRAIKEKTTINYELNFHSNQSTTKQRKKIFRPKPQKQNTFDWNEAYLEGLRIFDDDIDEAEAYADEMKRKKTGRL